MTGRALATVPRSALQHGTDLAGTPYLTVTGL